MPPPEHPAQDRQAWRRRYTAPVRSFPSWGPGAPDRLVYVSSESGSLQVWSHDLAAGGTRRLTDLRVGVEHVQATPDGTGAVWWEDVVGDERGRWMITALEGGEPRPLLEGIPAGWSEGYSMAGSAVAIALSDEEAFRVFVGRAGGSARELRRSKTPIGIGRAWDEGWGGLSADGSLLCLRVAQGPDLLHPGILVVDADTGGAVAELVEPGRAVFPAFWSPVAGDSRMALVHEPEGLARPMIWDPRSESRRDVALDLPGEVDVAGWWPDGSALLLIHELEGRRQLHRLDATRLEASLVSDPEGWISDAGVRPDGEVWLRAESGAEPPTTRTAHGRPVLPPLTERPPAGRPYRSFAFAGPSGDRIHGFVAAPDAAAPHPTVMLVHGGPDWAYPDGFQPWVQALIDHGYAVAMVNYRGSTGYGAAFRDALVGTIGFPEVEDTVAGLDALIAEGIVDPRRVAVEGWSWGGYVTLLALGIRPDRFAAGIAGIPVGDYVACHEDCSPNQQAYDVALMGGTPQQVPTLYRERSPITYVDRVRAPVLMIAGEHDSRCPIRQVRLYEDALRVAGGDVRLHLYEAGHHANTVEERLLHAELELAFLREHLG
jgi:dienelactone hydrolase